MSDQAYFVHETSVVDAAQIGDGTKIWHFSHIFGKAIIGRNCSFGQNVMVADNVVIGDNVKVQNNVAIYEGTTIEDDVFLGPSCVLTNVTNPRSQVSRHGIYEETIIRRGASIGANATVVCGVTLGRYCFIAAGAVVTRSVAEYAMLAGVPGREVGWMSRHGHRLKFDWDRIASCQESGLRYKLSTDADAQDHVRCLDLDEDSPIPAELSVGKKSYRQFQPR